MKISIEQMGAEESYEIDFREILTISAYQTAFPLLLVPDIILRILDYKSKDLWAIYSKRDLKGLITRKDTQPFIIQPIIDDRMFVVCAICDPHILDKYKGNSGGQEGEKYVYQRDPLLAKNLYALLFIDKGKEATCQNFKMVQELLGKAIYARWIDYGTIHAITHNSMFCLTAEYKDVSFVVDSFFTEYTEMLILLLAQRATIIILQERASRLSFNLKKEKGYLWQHGRENFRRLQREYAVFQNQMLLFEVTPQEQGIEIYQLLRRQLYLIEEQNIIEKQLHNLYELITIQQSANLSIGALSVSFIVLAITAFTYINFPVEMCGRSILCIMLFLCSAVFWRYFWTS